jgi:hypothetical protein
MAIERRAPAAHRDGQTPEQIHEESSGAHSGRPVGPAVAAAAALAAGAAAAGGVAMMRRRRQR